MYRNQGKGLGLLVYFVLPVAIAQGTGSSYESEPLNPSGPGGYIGSPVDQAPGVKSGPGYSAPSYNHSNSGYGSNSGSVNIYNSSQSAPVMGGASTQVQSENIQKQPTSRVEASPLTESRADQLRKTRQGFEVETEQKIVEKLESARIDDEKRRADRLFGDRFNTPQEQAPVAPSVNPPPQGAVYPTQPKTAPTPVVLPPPERELTAAETLENELNEADLKAVSKGRTSTKMAELPEAKSESSSYIGALVGMPGYAGVNNVQGKYALGVALANKSKKRFITEFSFLYSSFDLEKVNRGVVDYYTGEVIPIITAVDQYTGSLGLKYQLLSGFVRPVIGALAAYTYRSYTDTQYSGKSYSATSQAFDWGATAGVDVELDEDYTIGFEYRYMSNFSSQVDSGVRRSFSRRLSQSTPLEELNSYFIGATVKANF